MPQISNVHRIPNFLNAADVKAVLEYSVKDNVLQQSTSRAIVQADYNTEIADWTKAYTKKVAKEVTNAFGLDVVDTCGTALRNWYPGEKQDPHSDCEAIFFDDPETGKTAMTPLNNFSSIFIEYAALTYLNDDYEGGQIYFPDLDLEIKPSPGELIFFPGTQHYVHGVREVISGNRYALMTFFTTPKLKYIWKTFVQDHSDMTIVDRDEQQSMNSSGVFTRQNMPKSMMAYFQ